MDAVVRRLAALDLNLLVSLQALLQFRSVTAAAKHLSITQSTMSHQLARLRELIDDPVFVRHGNRMEPTPRIHAMAPLLARTLNDLHELLLAPPTFDPAAATGDVVVAMSDWAATQYVPFLLDLFGREAPQLRLRVEPPLRDDAVERLDWDVDLAMVSTLDPIPADRGVLLVHERFAGVARAGHPFCEHPPTAAAFYATPQVVVHSTTVPPALDVELERVLRLGERRAVTLAFYLAVPQALAHGDRVAVVPSSIAWGLVQDGGLEAFALPVALPRYHTSLGWSPLRSADPKIAWLRERITAFVASELLRRSQVLTLP